MADRCPCSPEAGSSVCATRRSMVQAPLAHGVCAVCGHAGKPVEGQTVKALLAVSLRAITPADYRFCRTATCPVVYFAVDKTHTFTKDQVRERVYQKEPDAADVFVCYCFRHTVGEIQAARDPAAIVADITTGIQAGQCACDLRNPQGSCCLGNVRALSTRHAGHIS